MKRISKSSFTFIDLFAGCGALSLGMEQAGFTPIFANEIWSDAAAKSYFLDLEGQTMSLPTKFLPSQALLEKHRELLVG